MWLENWKCIDLLLASLTLKRYIIQRHTSQLAHLYILTLMYASNHLLKTRCLFYLTKSGIFIGSSKIQYNVAE